MPNRFLFVVPRFHTNLYYATKALVDAGHAVAVFAPKREATEDYSHVTPRIFGEKPKRRAVRRAVRDFAPDLVLLRNARPVSQIVEGLGRFGRLNLVNYTQQPMTRIYTRVQIWEKRLQGLPLRRVAAKPGLNPGAAVDPNAFYLPWPVERDPEVPIARSRDGPLRVLCVGKLMQPRKNHDKLIGALEGAISAGQATLTIVGSTGETAKGASEAYLAELRRAAAASNGAIVLRENVDFGEMGRIYAAHDVCVLPAVREPLGSSPVEAMAYGSVPVISTGCGTAGYISDGVDGLRVDMSDAEALPSAMARLVADRELVQRLGAAARQTAETELGPARFVERMEMLVQKTRAG